MVELQHQRENLLDGAQKFQDKMKDIFDKRKNPEDFQLGDIVLQWDASMENLTTYGKALTKL